MDDWEHFFASSRDFFILQQLHFPEAELLKTVPLQTGSIKHKGLAQAEEKRQRRDPVQDQAGQ
jgi:hypothetical protein